MSIDRSSRHGWAVLFGLAWAVFAFGCAGGTTGEVRSILEPPYEGVGGAEVVRAEVLLPLAERAGEVVVTDAGEEHSAVNRTEAILPPPELLPPPPPEGVVSRGAWRMSVGGWWVVDVTADDEGAVVILREVEEVEARRVVYDPPLPMLPADLRMDEPIEFTSGVSVYNNDSGALEATGTVTATYRLLGKKTLGPDGLLAGDAPEELVYIVRVDRRYKLPLVVIDMKILSAYLPGEGPIAAHTVRVVKLLGLIPVVHKQSVQRR